MRQYTVLAPENLQHILMYLDNHEQQKCHHRPNKKKIYIQLIIIKARLKHKHHYSHS